MTTGAWIESIDSLKQFRPSLLAFAATVRNALLEAMSEIMRTKSWLEHEQEAHWKLQIRKRHELLQQAENALRQKLLYPTPGGGTPSVVFERQQVKKAKAVLAEAEQKLQNVRKWRQRLDKEVNMYRAQLQKLTQTVEVDLVKGAANIEQYVRSLEKYVATSAPMAPQRRATAMPAPTPSEPTTDAPSVARPTDETDDGEDHA